MRRQVLSGKLYLFIQAEGNERVVNIRGKERIHTWLAWRSDTMLKNKIILVIKYHKYDYLLLL